MWNLFKEVFRSLFKNKIVVSGLTILIFLTSGIFTLLYDTSKAMRNQFNYYKDKSVNHDLTVDFNLPSSGNAYNGGYYINGLTKVSGGSGYDKGIRYIDQNAFSEKNIIDFTEITDQYLKLSSFKHNETSKNDEYILRNDFLSFYNNYINEETLEGFTLNYDNQEKQIIFNKNQTFNLYKKTNNGDFIPSKNIEILDQSSIFRFDKEYNLNEISYITSQNPKDINISQIATLFINTLTKELTFDFIKGKEWEKESFVLKISGYGISSLLGFIPYNNQNNVFEFDHQSTPTFYDKQENEDITSLFNKKIKTELTYYDLFKNEEINIIESRKFTFKKNNSYILPLNWVKKQKTESFYSRKHYEITYNNLDKDKWTGSYKTFIENQIKNNNNVLPNDLNNFSYWTKEINYYNIPYVIQNNQTELGEEKLLRTQEGALDYNDFLTVDLSIADEKNQPDNFLNNIYFYQGTKKIIEIENIQNFNEEKYENLIDKNILTKKQNIIKEGALNIVKNEIYNYISEQVSKENIGIRQSITVDAFDDEGGEKKVFHFINTGNNERKIHNIKNNINLLINDNSHKNNLNNLSTEFSKFFTTKELTPYISSEIIKKLASNIIPDESYIKLSYEYNDLEHTNEINGDVNTYIKSKIYLLSRYTNNNPERKKDDFSGLGIVVLGDTITVVAPVYDSNNNIIKWKNVNVDGYINGDIPIQEINNYLQKNRLTLFVEILKDSWVAKSNLFSNSVYLPFVFRSPDNTIVRQALAENTLALGVERIEKSLLETDLVQKGFISKETIYAVKEAINISFDKNDFATIFSSGQINLNILPKMILDGIYVLSHNPNGDYFKELLTGLLAKVLDLSNSNSSDETNKKEYLKTEINKFFNFIDLLIGSDLKNIFNFNVLINSAKDISLMLTYIIDLVKSIDFKLFSDYNQNFFDNEYNKLVPNPDFPNDRTKDSLRKISSFEILINFLKSINQQTLKRTLINIINNIEVQSLFNFNNSQNIFNLFLGNLIEPIKRIFPLLNSYKNSIDLQYKNILDGIKFLINAFDFNIFIETLESKLKLVHFETERIDLDINKNVQKIKTTQVSSTLSAEDFIYSALKAFFNVPGSNKRIKDELIKMLNLSNKGSSQKIGDEEYLIIPSKDENKLDYFDLIALLNPSQPVSEAQPNNNSSFININEFQKVESLINYFKEFEKIEWETIPSDLFNLSSFYFKVKNKKEVWNKEQINKIINEWQSIINNLKINRSSNISSKPFWSLVDLYINKESSVESSFFSNFISGSFKSFFNTQYEGYNYLKHIVPLLSFWWDLFNPEIEGTIQEKKNFSNELLSLINTKEVLNLFNDFNLFQPSSQNILRYKETGFGISRSLANPEKMREFFFSKDDLGRYQQNTLRSISRKFPKLIPFIEKNSYNLTRIISYIASDDMYFKLDENLNEYNGFNLKYKNLLSSLTYLFINKYLTDNILNKYNEINYIFNKDYKSISLDRLGVSDVLLNPILSKKNPQVLLWMLSDTNNIGESTSNNSNLAYFINNKIINIEELVNDEKKAYDLISSYFTKSKLLESIVEKDYIYEIYLDEHLFTSLTEKVSLNPEIYKPFGIDLSDTIIKLINSITSLNKFDTGLVFNQSSSYVAKVNYAYLIQNNKEIYTGNIPENPIQLLELLNKLPDKYLLDVNGSKYLIIGDDISFDYFYPILDENNLQVNTKSQALVYVNDKGFDRIVQSYQGTLIKEYLTVKNNTKIGNDLLKKDIENFVQSKIDNNSNLQRTYLYDELDPLNPERSLRISSVEQLILSISYVSNIILGLLVFLVVVSVIFIIKRYISNKNKVIGILFAQGYTPLQIASSLTVFAFVTILIGNFLGYITGFMLQSIAIRVIDSYWTVPIQTLNFSLFTLLVNILIPLIAMSVLIITVSLRSLRYKSIDLMSGIVELSTSETYKKYTTLFKKRNIKTKFGASLIFNSFWKLVSFGISIALASITTIFGLSTFGVFQKTINQTYENRAYNYRIDLITPTVQGGSFKPLNPRDIRNNLYVPVGNISELNLYQSDYFKAGYSSSINVDNKNGIPKIFDGHLLTQFSVNLKIDSSISVDPFEIVYQSLPDVQKARILSTRVDVGKALTFTQKDIPFELDSNGQKTLSFKFDKVRAKGIDQFFIYLPNENNIIDGKFFAMVWDEIENKYTHQIITTSRFREEYREFLINGYEQLYKEGNVSDFLMIFNGIYFDELTDETYTYVDATLKDQKIRLYGYKKDSELIKVPGYGDSDLLKEINDEFENNNNDINKEIPLIINRVVADKFHLNIGSKITLKPSNLTYTYENKINEKLNKITKKENNYVFVVKGINQTFINNEFIIPKKAADKLIGLDELVENEYQTLNNIDLEKYKFNGILSKNKLPMQLLWSAGLYSVSGYSGSIGSFSIISSTEKDKKDLFDGIFGSLRTVKNSKTPGALSTLGYTDQEIISFIDSTIFVSESNIEGIYSQLREKPDDAINKFSNIFDDKLYVPSAYTLDSKEIEISFTSTIGSTVQTIITALALLCFLISIIILIIISTILIQENKKNIAIWSILGYTNKEKVKMFFGIYVPFIILSILISIPIAFGLMSLFGVFLVTGSSISLPIEISFLTVLITSSIVFFVFLITSISAWININKIKAIDLLKGK
ncbi:ABC transporter permease [Mycoplasmopsis felis]|uniref:ABC transporter permease n=1 Tax=Mycoplasmopsis felis TaxID=33923 RepID=UPI002AFEFABD|nr:ABC transporter permease [Mycoplasmopsis felis]WQQ08024.1 ABC transporter permease [Mycoplasmopsis felis]